MSSPDVRMAYLYEWVDPGGNRHFGGWVAVALGGFDWVLGDGTQAPAQAEAADSPADFPADSRWPREP